VSEEGRVVEINVSEEDREVEIKLLMLSDVFWSAQYLVRCRRWVERWRYIPQSV
jgi:hypothetical protein